MKINMKDWVQALIDNPSVRALPIMTHPGIELIERSLLEAVTDGAVHAQAVQALTHKYPTAAASSVIMDLTVEAEAFGAEVRFTQNEVPTVFNRLVCDQPSIEALKIPDLHAGRLPQYIKANALIASTATKPLLAGCIGPYSLAGRLYDMSEIMMGIYIDPALMKVLLQKCTDFLIDYCTELKRAGANGVIIAEPAAGLLSNDACREFSSAFVVQIVAAVQDDYFAVVLHNCGNSGQCTQAMVSTGAMGYHFGNSMDMSTALDQCPDNVLVLGNIDPVSIFKMASMESVYTTTLALLHQCHAHANFVISSGCDTPPQIPFENIDAFYRAVNDYNKSKCCYD